MRRAEIDKIRLENIEIDYKFNPPEYLINYFCRGLNYHIKEYMEKEREKQQDNQDNKNNNVTS